jgi:tRNA (guanosine-2'-O-)-methyltransferase
MRMRSEKRTNKIFSALSKRQPDLTVVIENIHDPHNVSAMLRSADAVGIYEVQLVYTKEKFPKIGKKSSSSANKWVERRKFDSIRSCYDSLRREGFAIYATRLDGAARNLYSVDLTAKTALVFGNEHAGVSEEAASLADATIMIPMTGMIQSLNVSVACAVTLYEALRQRLGEEKYGASKFSKESFDRLYAEWLKK